MRVVIILLGISFLLGGCGDKNKFPNVPVIGLQSWQAVRSPPSSGKLDSLVVTIRFTDGNGDLGLTEEDRNEDAFTKYPSADSSTFNLRYYNYFLTLFAENTFGRFDSIPDRKTASGKVDEISYNGRFDPTPDMNKGQPLEGTIRYVTPGFLFAFGNDPVANRGRIVLNKRYFIKVWIVDRSGNFSNIVVSDTLVHRG